MTQMGVVLMDEVDEEIKILGTLGLKKIPHHVDGVKEAGRLINAAWVRNQNLEWKDLDVIVEMPAPRWYGRANQVALLKICWQVLNIFQYFYKKARSVTAIDSFDWNIKRVNGKMMGQWNDHEKLEHFKLAFPTFCEGRKGTSKWGSKDVRDAALMGYWWYHNGETL